MLFFLLPAKLKQHLQHQLEEILIFLIDKYQATVATGMEVDFLVLQVLFDDFHSGHPAFLYRIGAAALKVFYVSLVNIQPLGYFCSHPQETSDMALVKFPDCLMRVS